MRKTALSAGVVAAAAVALTVGTALPASAGDTTTTFTLEAGVGGLSISEPATAFLGTAPTGGAAVTAALGAVTVSDVRGALVAAWSASVVSTSFTTGTATATETVPAADVDYWSGAATTTSGLGVFTPGQLTAGLAVPINAATGAFTLTAGSGNNTAAWNPTLIVAVGPSNVVGTYSGTVTHSVL